MTTDTEALDTKPQMRSARPSVPEKASDEAHLFVASQWLLMWWKFRRHRLALVATGVTLFLYLVAAFAGFVAPFDPTLHNAQRTNAPPQALHLIDRTDRGLELQLYVYDYEVTVDPAALRRVFAINKEVKIPIAVHISQCHTKSIISGKS